MRYLAPACFGLVATLLGCHAVPQVHPATTPNVRPIGKCDNPLATDAHPGLEIYHGLVSRVMERVRQSGPFELSFQFNAKAPPFLPGGKTCWVLADARQVVFLVTDPGAGVDYGYWLCADHVTLIDNATGAVIRMPANDATIAGTAYDLYGAIEMPLYWVLRAAAARDEILHIAGGQANLWLSQEQEHAMYRLLFSGREPVSGWTRLRIDSAGAEQKITWGEFGSPIFEIRTRPIDPGQLAGWSTRFKWAAGLPAIPCPPLTDLTRPLVAAGFPDAANARLSMWTETGLQETDRTDPRSNAFAAMMGPFKCGSGTLNATVSIGGPEPYDEAQAGWLPVASGDASLCVLEYRSEPSRAATGVCFQPKGQAWAIGYQFNDPAPEVAARMTKALHEFLNDYLRRQTHGPDGR